jgi:hypothetical protein
MDMDSLQYSFSRVPVEVLGGCVARRHFSFLIVANSEDRKAIFSFLRRS